MCGRLDYFLDEFARLGSVFPVKDQADRQALDTSQKAILLLAVLDHIESGCITRNFIEPSFDLAETFKNYYSEALPLSARGSMAYPFYQLDHCSFWELRPRQGEKQLREQQVSSVKQLQVLCLGAKFSDDLYPLLLMPVSREKLRKVLIDNHFGQEDRQAIVCQSQINCEAELYFRALVEAREPSRDMQSMIGGIPSTEKAREQGFSKAVVRVYGHRCGFCGIKIINPDGESIVDASHIKDLIVSQDDHPTNGMALCKICRFCFERGLMAVDRSYKVMISALCNHAPNLPGPLFVLSGAKMFKPAESCYWPRQENLEWYRKNRFIAN